MSARDELAQWVDAYQHNPAYQEPVMPIHLARRVLAEMNEAAIQATLDVGAAVDGMNTIRKTATEWRNERDNLRAQLAQRDSVIREMADELVRIERVRDIVAYGGHDPDCDRVDFMAVACDDIQRACRSEVSDEERARILDRSAS